MQTGLQAEALLCPNCKEEVPKTLYCLNCGYPLYKIEVENTPVEEDAPEPVAVVEAEAVEEEVMEIVLEPLAIMEAESVEEDVVVLVDSMEEIEAHVEEATSVAEEPETVEVEEVWEPVAVVEAEAVEEEVVEIASEPHVEPEVVQEEIVEIAPEPLAPTVVEEEVMEIVLEPLAIMEAESVEEDVVVLVDSMEEIEAPVEEVVAESELVEPVVEEIINIEPLIEPVADVNAEVEAHVEEATSVAEEPETVEVEEVWEPVVEVEPEVVAVPEYEPDPVVKEVMGNLAKNISMKIRLVDLLRTGGVKSEIFSKLFDSYMARGELLMNSRSEMLERVRYDLGSMEGALYEAKEGLEELDIRKAIEDVSEEEYAAKAPGFQWDIGQYKDEVGKKQADIYYLEDITRVMSSEENRELVGIGEGCFEALDELAESEGIDSGTAARIRVSLEEALACIR